MSAIGGREFYLRINPLSVRDLKIRYGEVLLRRHEVKTTSGDFTTGVVVRLSRRL